MKSLGVVMIGAGSATFSLAHYNDFIAALTGTLAFGIVAMKFWRSLKKTFLSAQPPKEQETKEETTVV